MEETVVDENDVSGAKIDEAKVAAARRHPRVKLLFTRAFDDREVTDLRIRLGEMIGLSDALMDIGKQYEARSAFVVANRLRVMLFDVHEQLCGPVEDFTSESFVPYTGD